MTAADIRLQSELDQTATNQATKVSYDLEYYKALLAAGQGALDRSRSAAQLVQSSAGAIGTLYGAILGVTFSVSGRALPLRGIVPAAFLGLAIALSAAYVAYMRGARAVELVPLHSSPPERLARRLENFFRIISAAVERRSYALRASVIALGVGVLFLALPFVSLGPLTPAVSPQTVNATYPWPDVQEVSNPASPVDQSLFAAQVAEVAAERSHALAQQTVQDPLWVVGVALGVGILLVSGIHVLGRRPSAGAELPG